MLREPRSLLIDMPSSSLSKKSELDELAFLIITGDQIKKNMKRKKWSREFIVALLA